MMITIFFLTPLLNKISTLYFYSVFSAQTHVKGLVRFGQPHVVPAPPSDEAANCCLGVVAGLLALPSELILRNSFPHAPAAEGEGEGEGTGEFIVEGSSGGLGISLGSTLARGVEEGEGTAEAGPSPTGETHLTTHCEGSPARITSVFLGSVSARLSLSKSSTRAASRGPQQALQASLNGIGRCIRVCGHRKRWMGELLHLCLDLLSYESHSLADCSAKASLRGASATACAASAVPTLPEKEPMPIRKTPPKPPPPTPEKRAALTALHLCCPSSDKSAIFASLAWSSSGLSSR